MITNKKKLTKKQNEPASPSDIINILRAKAGKRQGGLVLSCSINKDVVAIIYKGNKKMYILNNENEENKTFEVDSDDFSITPCIPLNKNRFLIFASGNSGMGKSSLIYLFCLQYLQYFNKRIFYICGTPIKDDINLSKIKEIKQIKGEDLENIVVDRDLKDSFVIFDDIDNWKDYHEEAIHIMNAIYETGRKYNISLAYLSHITSNARETKIYGEVDLYITNSAINNRMLSYHLGLSKNIIEEMDKYLQTDTFVCYNKIFNSVITDKRVYKV